VVLPGVAHAVLRGRTGMAISGGGVEWWCALEQPETGADTVAKGPWFGMRVVPLGG